MIVGYARTSTAEQIAGFEAQVRELTDKGAEKIFREQVSSMARREQLALCLEFVREGDVLMVTKPDRLARSTTEMLTIEADLTKRGIGLLVLSMGGAPLDTRNPTSRLILSILASVAEWERRIMLERQREGIAKAKAEGKFIGRQPTALRQTSEILRLRETGMKPDDIANHLKLGRSSVYRALKMGVVTPQP